MFWKAWRLYETNSLLDLADESLKLSESEVEDVKRVVQVGLMCIQSSQLRPAMSEVVARLLSEEFVRFELFRSASIEMADIRTRNIENFVAVVPDVNSSNATISMSHFSARWTMIFMYGHVRIFGIQWLKLKELWK